MDDAIRQAVDRGVPILGICLGMQLLFEESEEMGHHRGLDLIAGRVVRFDGRELKVPHMGWNQIEFDRRHELLSGVPSGSHVFFLHSFCCRPDNPQEVIAETQYGGSFASVVGRENVYGIQFHPEKSQKVGLQIIQNFANVGMALPDGG
jgi:glutamine amidotransferase